MCLDLGSMSGKIFPGSKSIDDVSLQEPLLNALVIDFLLFKGCAVIEGRVSNEHISESVFRFAPCGPDYIIVATLDLVALPCSLAMRTIDVPWSKWRNCNSFISVINLDQQVLHWLCCQRNSIFASYCYHRTVAVLANGKPLMVVNTKEGDPVTKMYVVIAPRVVDEKKSPVSIMVIHVDRQEHYVMLLRSSRPITTQHSLHPQILGTVQKTADEVGPRYL